MVVQALAGATSTQATWNSPTATDAQGAVTLTTTFNPGNTFNVGVTPVVYTATDTSGLEAACTFNVIVQTSGKN